MTDKDELLSQFFAEHEPPALDAYFLAEALVRAQKRRNVNAIGLWLGAGCVAAAVLALAGPAIGNAFGAMGPAIGPVIIVSTVLLMMRRMLWARA
ncbi:MAG: hypothetical protein WAU68_13415 [Vitreimonas sp.]